MNLASILGSVYLRNDFSSALTDGRKVGDDYSTIICLASPWSHPAANFSAFHYDTETVPHHQSIICLVEKFPMTCK